MCSKVLNLIKIGLLKNFNVWSDFAQWIGPRTLQNIPYMITNFFFFFFQAVQVTLTVNSIGIGNSSLHSVKGGVFVLMSLRMASNYFSLSPPCKLRVKQQGNLGSLALSGNQSRNSEFKTRSGIYSLFQQYVKIAKSKELAILFHKKNYLLNLIGTN